MNNPKPPSDTQNLHDSAPYFGACLPESCEFCVSDGGFGLFLKEMSFSQKICMILLHFYKKKWDRIVQILWIDRLFTKFLNVKNSLYD